MRMHPGVGVFVGVLALALTNCSSTYRDYCQSQIDCEGGNDKDVDACVDTIKGLEDSAGAYDCGDQFDDYWDCFESKAVCKDKSFSSSDDACKDKGNALTSCIKAASGKSNVDLEL